MGLKPAVDLELAEERANLSYFRDFSLNQQALEIDLLIIKKEGDQPIRNVIGRLFRKYNIIEYKSPKDELNIDTLYKVGAYTSLYKAYGDTVDERRADEITTSLIRKAKPVKLFRYFEEHGIRLENPFKGIYYVKDGVLFPTQIVVTKELNPQEHMWLTALSGGMQKQQLKDLLVKAESFHTKLVQHCANNSEYSTCYLHQYCVVVSQQCHRIASFLRLVLSQISGTVFHCYLGNAVLDRELADAVLGVAIRANWRVAQELRGDGNMCEALMELMEPEINKIRENVREETTQQVTQQVTQQGIKNAIAALKTSGHTNDAIKNFLVMAYSITQSEAEKYL